MNRFCYRAYVKGVLKAQSPFLTKAIEDFGASDTDMLVLRDAQGDPFIAGSSVAGVLRNVFDESDMTALMFGPLVDPSNNDDSKNSRQSSVITYDCFLSKGCKPKYAIRDGIRIKYEDKVTEPGAKFEYEVIEQGVCFDFKMELVIREDIFYDKEKRKGMFMLFNALIEQMEDGIYLGSKTNRGLGRFLLEEPVIYEICNEEHGKDVYDRYVGFDWNMAPGFKEYASSSISKNGVMALEKRYHEWELDVEFPATVIVRKYEKGNVGHTLTSTSSNNPVIPGTSWGGLFRHGARRILLELVDDDEKKVNSMIKEMFGSEQDANKKEKHDDKNSSRVSFSESEVDVSEGSTFTQMSNRIDRFTQGSADGGLFGSGVFAQGKTTLRIRYRDEWMAELLSLVIEDINDGLLAIGGQTSIGRGLCTFNFEKRSCEELFMQLEREW